MHSRYSPSWAIASVQGAERQAGSSYLSILLLALLGEDNLSERFALFDQRALPEQSKNLRGKIQ